MYTYIYNGTIGWKPTKIITKKKIPIRNLHKNVHVYQVCRTMDCYVWWVEKQSDAVKFVTDIIYICIYSF